MEATHEFKLLSGVSCVVRELTGKEQKILTTRKAKGIDNINEVITNILVSVGTITEISMSFAESLLSEDRRMILAEARQFSVGEDAPFVYPFEYTKNETGEKATYEVELNLEGGFPAKPYAFQVEEYSDIVKDQTFVLPRSGRTVVWGLLDGRKEKNASVYTEKTINSHAPISLRNPCYVEKGQDGQEKRTVVDLDRLSLRDIEALRAEIKRVEGKLDTEMIFEHPEAEFKISKNEKEVRIDLLTTPSFFFPSGSI